MIERNYWGARTSTRIIAGAYCIVHRGRIVRAAKASREETTRIWIAGAGSHQLRAGRLPSVQPVHYAS